MKAMTSDKYAGSVNQMLDSLTKIESNYSQISQLSSTRSFNADAGLYQQYADAGSALTESLSDLIDKEGWLELKWIDAHMWINGERVTVDGKEYVKLLYRGPIPEGVKRDNIAFRVGGTLTYDKDCYVTDIKLTNGADFAEIDISAVDAGTVRSLLLTQSLQSV